MSSKTRPISYETSSDTKVQYKKKAQARFPKAHGHSRRPGDSQAQEAQGTAPSHGVAGERLPRTERLRKGPDFANAFRRGARAATGGLVLHFLRNKLADNRLGVSLPSKAFRKSTQRNRVRRLMKEAYRKNKGRIRKGFDLVLIARPRGDASSWSYGAMEEALIEVVKKGGLLIES